MNVLIAYTRPASSARARVPSVLAPSSRPRAPSSFDRVANHPSRRASRAPAVVRAYITRPNAPSPICPTISPSSIAARARAPRVDVECRASIESALGVARRPSRRLARVVDGVSTRAIAARRSDASTRDRERAMSDAEDEDLTAIVEAGEDAVDRSVHPSGIVPVLQCVSSEAKTRAHSRAALDARKSAASGRRGEGIHSARNSIGATHSARAGIGADEGEASVARAMD